MAEINVDFSGIPEYKINNLCLTSMGHIPQKAVKPVWPGMPMTGTIEQYLPLGYAALNGLGESMIYVKFLASASGEGASIVPSDLTGTGSESGTRRGYIYFPDSSEVTTDNPAYSFVKYEQRPTGADENCIIFYSGFDATNSYGWVRFMFVDTIDTSSATEPTSLGD
jgi:hypothetical protein